MPQSRRQFLFFSAGLGISLQAAQSRSFSRDAERLSRKHHVTGLAIALIKDGKISETFAFGLRDVEKNLPVEADTVFEAASLSKPAFAYAVFQLAREGKLNMDEPLLPHVTEPFCTDPRLAKVTARMALAHTSGLPHAVPDGEPIRFQFDPGTKFAYSATGFDFLQRAVAKITGQPIEEFMRDRLFRPLKMEASDFIWTDHLAPKLAKGYDSNGKFGETFIERFRKHSPERQAAIRKVHPEINFPPAAAALYTTASDYAKFLIEMSDSKYDPMCKPQIKVSSKVAWGVGWGILSAKSGDSIWHWGNWSGLFQHFAAINRSSRQGIVVLTNSGNGLRFVQDFVPASIGLDLQPLKRFFE